MSDVQRQGKSVLILMWQINRRVSKREKGSSLDWGDPWVGVVVIFWLSMTKSWDIKKIFLDWRRPFHNSCCEDLRSGRECFHRVRPWRLAERHDLQGCVNNSKRHQGHQYCFGSQDQDDCSKRLLCELNARAAAGRSLSPNEELIAQVSSQPYVIYDISSHCCYIIYIIYDKRSYDSRYKIRPLERTTIWTSTRRL